MTNRDSRADETTLYTWDIKPSRVNRKWLCNQEGALNSSDLHPSCMHVYCLVSARGGSGRTGNRVWDAGCASAVVSRVWCNLHRGYNSTVGP